jgi:type III secretory pathway component EscR
MKEQLMLLSTLLITAGSWLMTQPLWQGKVVSWVKVTVLGFVLRDGFQAIQKVPPDMKHLLDRLH